MASILKWSEFGAHIYWSARPADALYTDSCASVVRMNDGNFRARLRSDTNYVDFDNEADAKAWCELMFNLKGEKYARKQ